MDGASLLHIPAPNAKPRITNHFLDHHDWCPSGDTQLIQELVSEGVDIIKRYDPTMDKVMRMHSVTSTIENGFVHIPEKAPWMGEFLHELTTFPKGKYDDQADSTSQALDWFKNSSTTPVYGVIEFWRQLEAEMKKAGRWPPSDSPLINRGALLREWDGRRG